MKNSWQTWLAFALCAGLAFAALAWLTVQAVRADLDRSTANHQAKLEQKISLALWRMDTKLAPLIAEEVARPASFFRNPNLQAFNDRQLAEGNSDNGLNFTVPALPENVFLNFSCPSIGECQSPQVPLNLSPSNVSQFDQQTQTRAEKFNELSQQLSYAGLLDRLPPGSLEQNKKAEQQSVIANRYAGNKIAESQLKIPVGKGENFDLQKRAERFDYVTQQEQLRRQRDSSLYANSALQQQAAPPVQDTSPVITGITRPLWVGENLLLARRVVIDGRTEIQGSWLNWDGIRKDLLAEAADLLPNADLSPVLDADQADPTRMLAGLPAQIIPGEKFLAVELSSPMTWALWIGWTAFLFSLLAAALLLAGVLALSERRAAFVSSVTHELRTPLTTFRMYSDMLARDMVPDSQRRQEYLETLRGEAERLTHLVENVLAYARLERGRKVNRQETVSIEKIVERLDHRLSERAAQVELDLVKQMDEETANFLITTDVGVVEQILFNLVDNACKYAVEASDRRLHWRIGCSHEHALLSIQDHGPGFERSARAKRSQPFSKTSEEAAATAPGVGLGLALCRQLAKQLGGRLDIQDSPEGVTATLRLPLRGS